MGEMLQVNSTLQELNLGGNPSCQIMRECQNTVFGYMTTDNKIGPEGAKALSDMLHTNTALTKLNICCKKKKKRPCSSNEHVE